MEPINILVALDENYLPPLHVMLQSLFLNNPKESFHIYLMHRCIAQSHLEELSAFCQRHTGQLHIITIDEHAFAQAPVVRYYTTEMYYRLLAYRLLPQSMERILYLDPDTLVLNSVRALYTTAMGERLFAACIHSALTPISEQVNKLRLESYDSEGYYNSGVLLLNLEQQRRLDPAPEIFRYVKEHKRELILPDQDILNGLFGEQILPLDDSLYNYASHRYETYRMLSAGKKDMDWVMQNTVIIHFSGKHKPWLKSGQNRFAILYKHYAAIAQRQQG